MTEQQEMIADLIIHYHQQNHSEINWTYHDCEAIWDIPSRRVYTVRETLIREGLLFWNTSSSEEITILDKSAEGYTTYRDFRKKQEEEEKQKQVKSVTNIAGRDMITAHAITDSFNKTKDEKEDRKINKKILFWTIAIVLLTAILVILALNHKG